MGFTLTLPGRVHVGRGCRADAAAGIAALGRRPLVLHGRSSARAADAIAEGLRAAGADPAAMAAPPGEPELGALRGLLADLRGRGHDAVVALGGGAVIDTAKALAALLPARTDPLDHLEGVGGGRPLEADPLPLAALPTTAGAGSEATVNAVIAVPEAGRKVSLRDARLMARIVAVDPDLGDGVPRAVRLASGLDAVVQVIEPYLSTRANPVTDALCRDAIPRGLAALRRHAGRDGADPRAGEDMALTALAGGIALTNAGLGVVHGLAGVIGGMTGAPHGAICGRLLVPALRAMEGPAPAPRLAELRGWIGGALGTSKADALDALEGWIDDRGLPRLGAMGLRAGDHADAARAALAASSTRTSPVAFDEAALRAILRAA
ncbi:MAG: iron-containing alcohol dehydrogenase [Hasllibacter sp.]